MFELLFERLESQVKFSEEERKIIQSYFKSKKLKRKQFFLQEGEICNCLAFIVKGSLYSYSIDSKGTEHVIQFGLEGWWIADLYSFFTKEPSTLNIEVLEDCELLFIEKINQDELMKKIPRFEGYYRVLYQNAYIALQKRIGGTIGLSAEEKYANLIEQYTPLLNRVPQHLIASYLGITPETLSRIRKQAAEQH